MSNNPLVNCSVMLRMSVLLRNSRRRDLAGVNQICNAFADTLCFAGSICSQWISHHHSQHDESIALHSSACKGDDHYTPGH